MEFLAVGKLKGNLRGKVLLLHGPPGVGKTSFALSLGEALGRKTYRVSLGGESDPGTLKGHRKTYVGARPGKIIEALKLTQSENCVIVLDEIDKTSSGHLFGDPQSTLLEILDPEQNRNFVDNFLDFPIDLSNVLFICTANDIGSISKPLLDRMIHVEIPGYSDSEKEEIFWRFILPEGIRNSGLIGYEDLFELHREILKPML